MPRTLARPLSVLLFAVSLTSTTPTAQVGPWEALGGPYQSYTNSTFFGGPYVRLSVGPDGAVLAAVSRRGVFRSLDGGRDWTRLEAGRNDGLVLGALEAWAPDRVLVTTSSPVRPEPFPDVYRSADGGDTWERSNPFQDPVLALEADDRGAVFAVTDGALHRSTDGGATWATLTSSGPWARVVSDLAVLDGQTVLVATNGPQAYRTDDDGATWQSVDAGGDVYDLDVSTDGTVYAATSSGIAASSDGGRTWTLRNGSVGAARSVRATVDALYAGVEGAVLRSRDEGATWEPLGSDPALDWPFDLAITPGGRVLAAASVYPAHSGGQALFGTDGSGVLLRTGVEPAQVTDLAWSEGTVLAATREDGAFRRETNGWSQFRVPAFEEIAQAPNGTLIVSGSGGPWRSLDGGSTWNRASVGLPSSSIEALAVGADGVFYLGASGHGVYRSRDDGGNWRSVGLQGASNALLTTDDGVVWAGGSGMLFRSLDEGEEWVAVPIPDALGSVWSLAQDANGTLWVGSDGVVGRSDDDGVTWTTNDLGGGLVHALEPAPDGLYAGNDNGLFYRPQGGAWRRLEDAPGGTVYAILPAPTGALYIGTDAGVFRSRRLVTASDGKPTTAFGVSVYPNPARTDVTFALEVSAGTTATVELFDVLGRRVRVWEGHVSPGDHRVPLGVGGVSRGTYQYRVRAEGEVRSGSLTVL